MKNYLLTAILFFFFIKIFSGCTKDKLTDFNPIESKPSPNLIDSAKDWFSVRLKTVLYLNVDQETAARDYMKILWQESFLLEKDGKKLMAIPVSFDYQNKKSIISRLLLLEVQNESTIKSGLIIEIELTNTLSNNDINTLLTNYRSPGLINYSGAIRFYNIGYVFQEYADYKNGILLKNLVLSSDIKASTNKNAKKATACTDWYIITYNNGVAVDERYVGRTCHCEQTRLAAETSCGGGGGGSSNAPASEEPLVNQLDCVQLRDWHFSPQKTIDDFTNDNRNRTWGQITTQTNEDYSWFSSSNGGPSMRQIADPLVPGVVIDLRHLLIMGKSNRFLGNAYEDIQYYLGSSGSGRDHQDYYSNELGYQFFEVYGASLQVHPENLAEYLNTFLRDPSLRGRYPVDQVKARCPN